MEIKVGIFLDDVIRQMEKCLSLYISSKLVYIDDMGVRNFLEDTIDEHNLSDEQIYCLEYLSRFDDIDVYDEILSIIQNKNIASPYREIYDILKKRNEDTPIEKLDEGDRVELTINKSVFGQISNRSNLYRSYPEIFYSNIAAKRSKTIVESLYAILNPDYVRQNPILEMVYGFVPSKIVPYIILDRDTKETIGETFLFLSKLGYHVPNVLSVHEAKCDFYICSESQYLKHSKNDMKTPMYILDSEKGANFKSMDIAYTGNIEGLYQRK